MEELLALVAIVFLFAVGWVVAAELLGKWITEEHRFFFAPALGIAACAGIAYVGAHSRLPWLIITFTCLAVAALLRRCLSKRVPGFESGTTRRLCYFSAAAMLCLYGMQISVFQLFHAIYPGPHEVWDVFNATGATPPDQMFSWHQAMFADLHRHYPKDPFYGEMDLYDRPHLSGYVTLFFFKLFHLPLTENEYVYPASGLRFYHCFWWLANNLYLLGIAPLFQRLIGYRAAIVALASTTLSGFVFLCNLGAWPKFVAIYPLLLAVLLFLNGKAPLLQAGLCVVSFYLHGSVLPFLAGFGLFQILCLYYPIPGHTVRFQDVVWFALTGIVLTGAWFVTVRFTGSKQPLLYYYLYDAGITQAQTEPVAQIARAFYARHTWGSMSLLPLHKLVQSVWPGQFFAFLATPSTWKLSQIASTIFESQRFCILAATGLAALPVALLGLARTLSKPYSGRTILAFYLLPTLLVALAYRVQWSFTLQIMCLYHAFVLFLWVRVLERARFLFVALGLAVVALEQSLCVLFSDSRFLPVAGLRIAQLTAGNWLYLAAYLTLVLLILVAASTELRRSPAQAGLVGSECHEANAVSWLAVTRKVLTGFLITTIVIASYSLYCLRFY